MLDPECSHLFIDSASGNAIKIAAFSVGKKQDVNARRREEWWRSFVVVVCFGDIVASMCAWVHLWLLVLVSVSVRWRVLCKFEWLVLFVMMMSILAPCFVLVC